MKKIINRLINHPHLLPFLLFTFIFAVYFSSSVGLINSGDTPQYFTTEAIMKNRNLDLAPFQQDPHFFVWPDYWTHNNQQLSFRGYLFSVITIPMHILSKIIYPLFRSDLFSQFITITPNFLYELSITSLYSLFSVLAFVFYSKLIKEITGDKFLSFFLPFIGAFGTFSWKYNSYYSRQGIVCFLIALYLFALWRTLNRKNAWFLINFLILTISFGVDIVLFLILGLILLILFFYSRKNFIKIKNSLFHVVLFVIPLFLIAQIIVNVIYYGQLIYAGNSFIVNTFLKNKLDWFSTPLFPTIFSVMFNLGKMPSVNFNNFFWLPKEIGTYTSFEFAMKYNFFGIFSISPFLLFSFVGLFLMKKRGEKIKLYNCVIWLLFFLGLILGIKSALGFWGGNQYDVRYYYPYALSLLIPTAFGLQYLFGLKNKIMKIVSLFAFGVIGLFSIFMGWLGVIQMYKPALTGERKIWVDLFNASSELPRHSFRELLDATFMNRENAWIAIVLSFIFYFLLRFVLVLSKIIHYEK